MQYINKRNNFSIYGSGQFMISDIIFNLLTNQTYNLFVYLVINEKNINITILHFLQILIDITSNMSIYSGFATRKIEETYNKLLSKLIVFLHNGMLECFSLIQQNDELLKRIKNLITQSKIEIFQSVINKMKLLEEHKYLQPKFSIFCYPLRQKLSIYFLNENLKETTTNKQFIKTFQSTSNDINSKKILYDPKIQFNLTLKSNSSDKRQNFFKHYSSRKSAKFLLQQYSTQKIKKQDQGTKKANNAQKIRIHKSSDNYIDYNQFTKMLPVDRQLLAFQTPIKKNQRINSPIESSYINKQQDSKKCINTNNNNECINKHNNERINKQNNSGHISKHKHNNINKDELNIHSQSQLIQTQECKMMPVFVKSKSTRYQNFNRTNFKNLVKKQKITHNIEDKIAQKQIQNLVEQNIFLSNTQKVYKKSSQWYEIQKQIQKRQQQK